jgi:hypothetical protein
VSWWYGALSTKTCAACRVHFSLDEPGWFLIADWGYACCKRCLEDLGAERQTELSRRS